MANNTCSSCNADLEEGAKFCPSCGKEILVAKFCSQCGASLKPGDKFCSGCGHGIGSTPPQVAASPNANSAYEEKSHQSSPYYSTIGATPSPSGRSSQATQNTAEKPAWTLAGIIGIAVFLLFAIACPAIHKSCTIEKNVREQRSSYYGRQQSESSARKVYKTFYEDDNKGEGPIAFAVIGFLVGIPAIIYLTKRYRKSRPSGSYVDDTIAPPPPVEKVVPWPGAEKKKCQKCKSIMIDSITTCPFCGHDLFVFGRKVAAPIPAMQPTLMNPLPPPDLFDQDDGEVAPDDLFEAYQQGWLQTSDEMLKEAYVNRHIYPNHVEVAITAEMERRGLLF